jgi:acyl-CoA thioester hydrolase
MSSKAKQFIYKAEVYFDQLDALGILHHTRYLLFLERAQQKFFQHLLGVDDFNAERDEDIYVVVHSLNTRYRQPLSQPGLIEIRYSLQRIRSGGVTMAFEIYCPCTHTLLCTGDRTVCKLSAQTQRPCPWTPAFKAAMEAFS